jgi:2-haloacid dehalogenase
MHERHAALLLVDADTGVHAPFMSRRKFLQVMGGAALATTCGSRGSGCVAPHSQLARRGAADAVRAIAFDLFTIFDPRSVDRRLAAVVGKNAALAATWKSRLFEYCWIRAASGQYEEFGHLVHDALVYAEHVHGVEIPSGRRAELEDVFTELDPWPEAPAMLRELKARGLRLAPLSNFDPPMIESLVGRTRIRDLFEALISTAEARTYKPHPGAYALAEATLGLPREQIAFAAFGGWDAAGAKWFGFPTFWVNPLGAPAELVTADSTGPSLAELAAWLRSR